MPNFLLPGTGKVLTPVGTGNDYGQSLAIQPDGKVLLGGYAIGADGSTDFALVRYNADGSLDTTFGQGGKLTTPVGTSADQANSVTVQPDGKILLGGYSIVNGNFDFALVRYNADGSLDTTFGQGGKLTTPVGTGSDQAYSVTLQPDGRILLSGSSYNGQNYDFSLTRYNADGSLDTSFGTSGKVLTPLGSGDDLANSVTVQTDGKVLLGGYTVSGGNYSFALTRYNADGALDTTFGQGGKLVTPVGSGEARATSVTTQTDGKILLGGWAWNGSNFDFALVRYTAAGALDTSFGQGGKILTPIGAGSEFANSVTVQPDGRILLAGNANNGSDADFAVVRYNADGSLDTSFGSGGKVVVPVGPYGDSVQGVRVQADGKIVLGGWAFNNAAEPNLDFAVVRLNANGSLDTGFGAASTLGGSAPFTEGGTAIVLAPNATLADPDRGGASYAGTSLSLARQGGASADDRFSARSGGSLGPLTEGGSLTYGGTVLGSVTRNSGGVLTLSFSGGSAAQVSAVLREIAYANASTNPPTSVALAWSFAEGSANPSPIGVSQVVINAVNSAPVVTAASGSASAPEQVATVVDAGVSVSDPDSPGLTSATVAITGGFVSSQDVLGFSNTDAGRFGNIVGRYDAGSGVLSLTSAGGTATAAQFQAALRSVTYLNTSDTPSTGVRTIGMSVSDGSLGSAVASRTVTVVPVDDTPRTGKVLTPVGTGDDRGQSLAIQPDGKVLLAGYAVIDGNDDFAVVRYNQDGSLDTTFGQGGKVVIGFGAGADQAYGVVVQPNGRIVVGGWATVGTDSDFALVGYNPDGSLDTGFGANGKVVTPVGVSTDQASSLMRQPDGKLLLAGRAWNGQNYDFALVRYNADGSLDTNFGSGGKILTPVGTGSDAATSVTVQADGKLILGGIQSDSSGSSFALVRYTANGTLDTSFGQGGKVTTPIGSGDSLAYSVLAQPDGKVLLAGHAAIDGSDDFAVVRYNQDGSLDTSFGLNGKVLTPVGTGYDYERDAILQPDGKILLIGEANDGSSGHFAAIRYNTNGILDTNFGQNGKVIVAAGLYSDAANSVRMQTDGKILLGGWASNGDNADFAVMRLNADGSLDTSFGAVSGASQSAYMITSKSIEGDFMLVQGSERTVSLIKGDASPEISYDHSLYITESYQAVDLINGSDITQELDSCFDINNIYGTPIKIDYSEILSKSNPNPENTSYSET